MPITYQDSSIIVYTSGPVGDNLLILGGRIHLKQLKVFNDTTAKRWAFVYDLATVPTPSDQPITRVYMPNKGENEIINLNPTLVMSEGVAIAVSKNADVLNQETNVTKYYFTIGFA